MAAAKTKRQSYTTAQKLNVIQFAEQQGNRSAQQEFGIAENDILPRQRSKENLEKMLQAQCANCGRKWLGLAFSKIRWLGSQKSKTMDWRWNFLNIRSVTLLLAGEFKASNHWCQRFMKRNGLLLRQKTTLAQSLPRDYEEKIVQFHLFVIRQRRAHNYPLHLVANMDESPIQFDMPSNRTVSTIGEKTVKI